jgi:hypothetical protein
VSELEPTPDVPQRPWRRRVLLTAACVAAAAWGGWQLRTREPTPGRTPPPAEPGAVLDVHVVAAGQPVEGARVTTKSGKTFRSVLRSDADGTVQVRACPRAQLSVLVEAAGLERAVRTLDMVGRDTLDLRVELAPGARLNGRVHDESGRPVGGVVITVRLLGSAEPTQESPWFATTQLNGTFSVDTLPQTSVTLEANAGDLYEPTVVAEIELPNEAPVDVLLRHTGVLTGKVISKDGAGVANARVTLAGSGVWPARSLLTDLQGEFRFDRVPDGIYELRAEHDDDVSAPLEGIPISAANEAHVELMLSPGLTLRGSVRDIATGHALPNAEIEVSEESLSAALKRTHTGADGRYQLSGLRPLAHRVSARAAGYVTAQKWATPGESGDLELLRAIVVSGSVQDAEGRPVPQAELEVSGKSVTGLLVRMVGPVQDIAQPNAPDASIAMGSLGVTQGSVPRIPLLSLPASSSLAGLAAPAADGSFRSDERGRFRLEGLPPGELLLAAHKPGFVTGRSRPLHIRPGEALTDVVIVLAHGEALSGRVVDGHGMPVARVRVELSAPGEPARTTVSAADGGFRFDAVRGECTLVARPSGAPLAKLVVPAQEVGKREVELVLESVSDHLAGRVLDGRGQPIESASVHLETRRLSEFVATAVSGPDGAFEFGALPAPPYRVRVDHPDYAPSAALEVTSAAKSLVIRLEPGAELGGAVTAQTGGEPIVGARLSVQAGEVSRTARSNRQGTFEFRHLPIGGYTLFVEAEGFIGARAQGELQTSRRALERVVLVRAGRASGEVVDRLGATVWNAEVTSGSPPDWDHAVRTDHAGHFELGQLMPGYHSLIARHHGQVVVADQPVRIYEGEESPGAVLRLPGVADDTKESEPAARPGREAAPPSREPSPAPDSTKPGQASAEPAPPSAEPPSATAAPVSFVSQGNQVVVDRVSPGSAAARGGLLLGDILLSVGGEPVRSPAQARGMLSPLSGTTILLTVRRGGVTMVVRYGAGHGP